MLAYAAATNTTIADLAANKPAVTTMLQYHLVGCRLGFGCVDGNVQWGTHMFAGATDNVSVQLHTRDAKYV